MADRGTSYATIMSALRQGTFAPVYLLMGEESFFIDSICDFIVEHVLDETERDFNQTIVFGADTSAEAVATMAKRYPIMASRQLVVVKEAQAIKNWEAVETYLERPQPTTVLVICYKNGTIDGRKKIVSRARTAGVLFESAKKRDYELSAFVEQYARSLGASIDNKSAQMISQHIGNDLCRIVSEIDKVIIALGDGELRITPEVVERQVGVSKDYNGYELRTAIANRDAEKAYRILNYFNSNPKAGSPYALIPVLFSYFQLLMMAYYAPNRNNENELARFLDLRGGWAARDYITGMRNYSGVKVMNIIGKLRETDAKSKGLDNPNTGVGELLQELVAFILH